MSVSGYLKELASSLDLSYVEKIKPFEAYKDPLQSMSHVAGSIVGERRGFLIVLSLISTGHGRQVCILIRYPKILDVDAVSRAAREAFQVTRFQLTKKSEVTADSLMLHWNYTVKRPAVENVARAVDQVIGALTMHVNPFSNRCEECAHASEGILLVNGIPRYLCPECRRRLSEERQRQAEAYRQRDTGFVRAFLLAGSATVTSAIGLSWLYYFLDDGGGVPVKAVLIVPGIIGVVAGLVFAKTAGRIQIWTQGLPLFLLCFAGSFGAAVAYSAHVRPAAALVPLWVVYLGLAKSWVGLHLQGKGFLFVLGHLLSGVCCVGVVHQYVPNFEQVVIPLHRTRTTNH